MESEILGFFRYIFDRQNIWFKRKCGLVWPWSDSVILNSYKFCSAYRELDRGTIILINHVCKNQNLSNRDKLFWIVFYRKFNTPDFFDALPKRTECYKNFDFKYYEKYFDKRRAEGFKLFNSAYNLSQVPVKPDYRGKEKHIQMLLTMDVLKETMNGRWEVFNTYSPQIVWENLQEIPNIGPFLAYQILTDLSYCNGLLTCDPEEFVYVGPGALQTIEMLPLKGNNAQAKCKSLSSLQAHYWGLLQSEGKNWNTISYDSPYFARPWLSLSNIQHNCCEYRKFLNLSNPNRKTRKRFYKPTGGIDGLF